MAETVGQFYTSAYLQTHMQRYQLALQMAQQQAASQMVVAQMLNDQLRNLDKQIADIKGAKSSSELNSLIKAYQLKQSVMSDRARRQISIYDQVNDIFDVSSSLPTINNAGDSFASSLATAGSVESKAQRAAGSVGGYSRSTDQAKAVAAATYSRFRADAYRKGQRTKFDANDAAIRKAIADTMGVKPADIDTADVQKEKMLRDRLQAQGGQAISTSDLNKLIDEFKADEAGDASPASQKDAIEQLLLKRTELSKQQQKALAGATQSPEATIARARNIYRSQFAPIPTQQKQQFANYVKQLNPTQQMITLGFVETKPGEVNFMKKPRAKIVKGGDQQKIVAYDLFYAAQKDIKAGKAPGYLIHTKVAEAFPNDTVKQQKVLGYIFRAQAEISGTDQEKAIKKNKEIEAAANKVIDEQPEIPTEQDVIFDESGGTIDLPPDADAPAPPEDPASGNQPGDTEEQPEVEIPTPPTVVTGKLPKWATEGTVTIVTPGTYKIESQKYGNFTIGPDGKVLEGSIKLGTPAGWISDLNAQNPQE